jgi:inner membrane protein
MSTQNSTSFFNKKSTHLTLKICLIGILTLLLLIPQAIIESLIHDREKLSDSVISEVSSGWGGNQIVTGPVLVIPYFTQDTVKVKTKSNVVILPKKLKINGDIGTTNKHRSIYEVALYQSKMELSGSFDISELKQINVPSLLLNEAHIVMGIADLKGIQNNVDLYWSEKNMPLKGGMNGFSFYYTSEKKAVPNSSFGSDSDYPVQQDNQLLNSGLSCPVSFVDGNNKYDFNLKLDLKGSRNLLFTPLSSNTDVAIKSAFKDPSFVGKFLPDNTVSSSGFEAKWKILEYNRNIEELKIGANSLSIEDNLFGVKLEASVDNYTKTNRAIKYMLLIIALTFLVVFLTELIEKKRIHIFQYALVGIALAIFYTLLLAFSEIISFDLSYLVSAIAIITLLYLYSLSLFKSKKSSGLLLGLTTLLFAYIYSIIQLEKTALLFGAIGLFIIIAGTMYATRKINWYENEATIADAENISIDTQSNNNI